jgi:hypothetical protein
MTISSNIQIDVCSLPDGDPVVDNDLDPAAEPESEVEDAGVLFRLRETLILGDDLKIFKILKNFPGVVF